ncbi:MAG: L-serine ammonia-lyase, iron-sulfur-dependent, subunit alpha [Bacilli bacterium]|jgi:L-serine dehydratase|nr:L-serine ammonia-lyase, iron-sulfur-dependent, subunit alpha [Bacilli bacterium]
MESIKNIYLIGRGPSSSHTMGPEKASKRFLAKNPQATHFKVELYGSLALTGKGHMTDKVIREVLGENTEIAFLPLVESSYHPNCMKFFAYLGNELIDEWKVYSVGGGELKEEGEERKGYKNPVFPHHFMEDILAYCKQEHISLVEYVDRFEAPDLNAYLETVLNAMDDAIKRGIATEGVLPGRLKIKRKAKTFYEKYLENHRFPTILYAYSLATSEENASSGIIVTAPTCGSCGVLPSVLLGMHHHHHSPRESLIKALKIAGLIGNLVKHNASISGAEVGCQGEVGVACSMAAAAAAYLKGGNNSVIEYAAEIALEHHLGMTCDPIDGMVQIPCIERNALSAQYAINASEYALMTDGAHHITLDSVIEVMKETGKDMHAKYRETSLGGLATVKRTKEPPKE